MYQDYLDYVDIIDSDDDNEEVKEKTLYTTSYKEDTTIWNYVPGIFTYKEKIY
jgi:hypothetical protein